MVAKPFCLRASRLKASFFRTVFVGLAFVVMLTAAPSWGAGRCESLFESREDMTWKSAFATGTVKIDGRVAYYESLPAARGKPTVLLFIGAYTPVTEIAAFQKSWLAQRAGEGLIVYAYSTALESVARARPRRGFASLEAEEAFAKNLSATTTDFVRQATAVVNTVGVRGPVTAVGYSFGSAAASEFASFHRGRVTNLVFVAPFVTQGEHAPQLLASKAATEALAFFGLGYGASMLEGVRSNSAKQTAKSWIDRSYDLNPLVREIGRDVSIRAIAAQIRSVDTFDLRLEPMESWPRTYFLLAGRDNVSRFELQNEVIGELREAAKAPRGVFGGATVLKRSEHEILSADPDRAAKLILKIANRR